MKLILDVKNPERKYTYNVYSVFEYEDGAVSEDSRKLETDDLAEFLMMLGELIKSHKDTPKEVNGFCINQKVKDKITGEEFLIFDWDYSDKFVDLIDRVWIDKLGELPIYQRKFNEIEPV